MRIALDVTPMTAGSTGVARYTRELHAGLRAAEVDVAAFAIGRGEYAAPEGTRRVSVPLRVAQHVWLRAGRPRVEDLVGEVDLAHCVDLVPLPSRAPRVMTAHDLVAIEYPELHSGRQVRLQLLQLECFRKADLVLADSAVTAQVLVDRGVPAGIVAVVLLGVGAPSPASPHPGRYVLAVGELAERKNLPLLVAAFRAARLPEDVELLLVGPDGHGAGSVRCLVDGRVRALGRVDDDALARLYAGAMVFCFPSLAEGFGLPVLEAMQAGAPVLASDLPVLRELAGGAAAFVDARDVSAWTRALEDVVLDDDRRAAMASAGRDRAAGRTWNATVAQTLSAYLRIVP